MLQSTPKSALRSVAGVVYLSPFMSKEGTERIRRFVREHAKGNYRWGSLYRYPTIEFDDIDDLTATRTKFASVVEGYKDLSDCPEPADADES
jgi:hypothetical protein